MKKLLFVLLPVLCFGDLIDWTTEVESFADGDTFFTDIYWHPLIDTVQSIVNGRLDNENIAADAAIDQSKIDSTGTTSSDWIYQRTKALTSPGNVPTLRSQRGMNFFINDTTANTGKYNFVTDSTDTIFSVDKSGNAEINGAFTSNTLNTGQGASEVYPHHYESVPCTLTYTGSGSVTYGASHDSIGTIEFYVNGRSATFQVSGLWFEQDSAGDSGYAYHLRFGSLSFSAFGASVRRVVLIRDIVNSSLLTYFTPSPKSIVIETLTSSQLEADFRSMNCAATYILDTPYTE